MSATLVLDAPTERVAVNLLRHLEWQNEGFSLVFLFADVGPSLQLADWLDQRLATQGQPLQRQDARDSFVREPEAAVDAFVASFDDLSAQPGGVWYAVQRHPGDAQWNRARTLFLARLNERRFLLERDLSEELRAAAASVAPDVVRDAAMQRAAPVPDHAAMPAFDEWTRLSSAASADQVFLPLVWNAIDELLAAGRPGDAENVALSALALSRRRVAAEAGTTAERELSISLNNVGRVACAQGDWTQAESAYRESLALRRQLVERLGGAPEALDDLAEGLIQVAELSPGDEGQRDQALDIYRQLATRFPDVPRFAEQLSVLTGDNVPPDGTSEKPTP